MCKWGEVSSFLSLSKPHLFINSKLKRTMKTNLTKQQVAWIHVQLQKEYERTLQERCKFLHFFEIADTIGYNRESLQRMIDDCNLTISFLKQFAFDLTDR